MGTAIPVKRLQKTCRLGFGLEPFTLLDAAICPCLTKPGTLDAQLVHAFQTPITTCRTHLSEKSWKKVLVKWLWQYHVKESRDVSNPILSDYTGELGGPRQCRRITCNHPKRITCNHKITWPHWDHLPPWLPDHLYPCSLWWVGVGWA